MGRSPESKVHDGCVTLYARISKNDKNADPCGSMCIYIYIYYSNNIYIYQKRCGSLNLAFHIFRSCFFQNLDSPPKKQKNRGSSDIGGSRPKKCGSYRTAVRKPICNLPVSMDEYPKLEKVSFPNLSPQNG